mgnify:CR=1 FL=1
MKRIEAITEKSTIELKRRQKSERFTKIRRQAIRGLEGIIREGRGHWPLAFPYRQKSVNYISAVPDKKDVIIGYWMKFRQVSKSLILSISKTISAYLDSKAAHGVFIIL